MVYKKGSKGKNVFSIQKKIGVTPDGIYGGNTESAVIKFQKRNNITADGIVRNKTLIKLKLYPLLPENPLDKKIIHQYHMEGDEYFNKVYNKEYLFIHHTEGWNNPYKCIDDWENDNRGRVATEFLIGGQHISNKNNKYDGVKVQAFPDRRWSYHLGSVLDKTMNKTSVGIELCAFGKIKSNKTWAGTKANPHQIYTLEKPFRKNKNYHRYSNNQISALRDMILFVCDRDNIDAHDGLYKFIKCKGYKGFDYVEEASRGLVKGILSHSNVRTDKSDVFPQDELMDMILCL